MPFFSEAQALGSNPSPWSVNGTDLYPDSTSYLVGIGTSNPDKALHIKASDGAGHVQFEGTGNSFFVSVETQGVSQSQALKFSQAYYANAFFDFETDVTNASASADVRIIADNAQRIYFRDRTGANDLAAILSDKTRERLYIYGDDGFAGGMFTMDWAQANDTRFGFGYGDEALSDSARLAIKHTTDAQLLLDDGTANATVNASNTDLTVEHSDASWNFTLNATTNTNLAFAKGGTIKASIRHYGDTEEGVFGPNTGIWRNNITAASAASQTVSAANGFGNVIAMDTTSNAITATLPAVANYSGTVFYVIDSKGNAATNNITIAVQTGEKLDGVLNGTGTISANNGFAVYVCTADGWFTVSS